MDLENTSDGAVELTLDFSSSSNVALVGQETLVQATFCANGGAKTNVATVKATGAGFKLQSPKITMKRVTNAAGGGASAARALSP